jgi:hypothetical protein
MSQGCDLNAVVQVVVGSTGRAVGQLAHLDDEWSCRLQQRDWNVAEVCFVGLPRPVWCVSGSNGESVIAALGHTSAEAWQGACSQAEALGMLVKSDGGPVEPERRA